VKISPFGRDIECIQELAHVDSFYVSLSSRSLYWGPIDVKERGLEGSHACRFPDY
jgi:hypothetical protein